jgi:hypothetical protein
MIHCPKCGYQWRMHTRSGQQNKAYFKLIVETLAKECNTNKDAMHKALAGEFLGFDIVEMPGGNVISVPKSTQELTTIEFINYVEKIQRYAAENGLVLPDPKEKI